MLHGVWQRMRRSRSKVCGPLILFVAIAAACCLAQRTFALCGGRLGSSALTRRQLDSLRHERLTASVTQPGRAASSRLSLRAWFRQTEPDALLGTVAEQNTLDEVLTFLVCAVIIAPLSRQMKLSPTLGFLLAGAVLGPFGFGVFADDESVKRLADIGILFLLFEQGLELSSKRLEKLSVFAFGLGALQVIITGLVIAAIAYNGGAVALEPLALPDIRGDMENSVVRLDQITVIAVSLALSSSAFVLKVCEENQLGKSIIGEAALGVLLFQDIAVVPLLVILPLIEDTSGASLDSTTLATYVGTALAGLALIGLLGKFVLRKLFDTVASTRSQDTFVSLCVLCVLGTGQFTEWLGLSTTLGAFLAGTLLAESNYRTQVEADIAPFKGLLLGLFFLTTGAQVDPTLLAQEWELSLALLLGLTALKTVIIAVLSPLFGLAIAEGAQLGFLLAGGGEFAFVIFALCGTFNILPLKIIKILTGVVVISMALTPVFAQVGAQLAEALTPKERKDDVEEVDTDTYIETELQPAKLESEDRVALICGMGPIGQQVASFFLHLEAAGGGLQWIGLDLDQNRVSALRALGQPVFYGDGSKLSVLTAAGLVAPPKVIIVTYATKDERKTAVERLRYCFPDVAIITHASSASSYAELRNAGESTVVNVLEEIGEETTGKEEEDETLNLGDDIAVVSSVVETARRLGHAAVDRIADVPSEVQQSWSRHVRRATESRLLNTADNFNSADKDSSGAGMPRIFRRRGGNLIVQSLLRGRGLGGAESRGVGSGVGGGARGSRDKGLQDEENVANLEASTFLVTPDFFDELEMLETYDSVAWENVTSSSKSAKSTLKALRYLESISLLQSVKKQTLAPGALDSCPTLTWRTYAAGETVIEQSKINKMMFIVESGACEATIAMSAGDAADGKGDDVVARYTSGASFGELSIFVDKPSTVTIKATTDAELLVVDRPTFVCLLRSGNLDLQGMMVSGSNEVSLP